MINSSIVENEFWSILDTIRDINWDSTLDAWGIEDDSIAKEIEGNKALDAIIQEILNTPVNISFLITSCRAVPRKDASLEVLMQYAMRLGYAMHQYNIIDITKINNEVITYDDMFSKYECQAYFEIISDFLTDKQMCEQLGITKIRHESFIYFAIAIGYIIRGQINKIDMCPEIRGQKEKYNPFNAEYILIGYNNPIIKRIKF